MIIDVYLKDSSYVIEEVMGEHTLILNFLSRRVLDIQINDYVEFEGSVYKIRHNEKVTKRETSLGWEYSVTFYSERYSLQNVEFFLNGVPERKKNFDSYTGTARQVLELLVKNMNRVEAGWKSGSCIESRVETFTFKDKKCDGILDEVVKAFDTEYWIVGKTISIGKRQYDSNGLILGQGEGMGFTELEVSAVDDAPPITVIYPYGSDKNLSTDYGSDYLLLPSGKLSIEKNVDKYGRIELSKQFDHIFPKGEFTVTERIDTTTLKASGIDFNLTDCLLDGVEVIVTFQGGGLAGYDLAIVEGSWDNAKKQFKLKQNAEENALKVPGDINFAVGDKFILTGLKMPQSYINKASAQLQEEAGKWLDEHCEKRIQLRGKCDDVLFRQQRLFISCGQMVGIVSDELNIDREIRVTKVKRYIENDNEPTYRYELTLSDFLQSNGFKDMVDDVKKVPDEIDDKIKPIREWTKRSWRDVMETMRMMFDPEGDYFTELIKPLAVHTAQLIVGTNSQQMDLIGIKFSPNADNDANYFKSTAGKLVHFTVRETIAEWTIASSAHRLNNALPYYIYAKCSKTTSTGSILATERKIKLEEETGYYHFWVGVLNTPEGGVRSWNPNYGFTEIAGQTVTTGVIKDKLSRMVIDLVNGTILGPVTFGAGSSGLDNVEEWPAAKKEIEAAQTTADDAVKEIGETNKVLSGFEKTVNGAFKDGIIEAAEAKAIEKYINILNTEKADADAVYTKLYANIYLGGVPKTDLFASKTAYNTAHTNLISAVNAAIADGRTSTVEKSNVDSKFTLYKNALSDYRTKIESANKAIQDTLKSYSDAALEKGKEAFTAAGNAQVSASQAKESVTILNNYVDGAFEDGVISQAEAKAIEKYLNTVKASKAEVEATYNKLYVNSYLFGTAKTDLLNSKVTLFGAIDALLFSIGTAISDGKTTVAEKTDVDNKFAVFNTALASFNTAVESANKSIQDALKGYSDTALEKGKEALAAAGNAQTSANQAKESVTNLNAYVDGAFSDGIISEAEAKSIEKYLNTVANDQASVEATYNTLYANTYLTGVAKTGLQNAKNALMTSIANLKGSINTAIGDGKTTTAEKADVDSKFSAFNTTLGAFNTAVELANKAIQDALKEYSNAAQKKGEEALAAAGKAQESANKAGTSVSDLNKYVDGAFADGLISGAEAKAIEKYSNTVKSTKASVEATYNTLYSNAYLTGTAKSGLLNAKVTLFGSIDNLLSSINTAISDDKTTAAEKADVDAKFASFNTALSSFYSAVETVNKSIQDALKGYSDGALQKGKDALAEAERASNAASDAQDAAGNAQGSANTANSTANSKARVFYQATAPLSGMKTNDLWVNGIDIKRWSGSSWDFASAYDNTETRISGGLVTTGAVAVGPSSGNTGGIAGSGSIRIWSGAAVSTDGVPQGSPTFRVYDSGAVHGRNSIICEDANGDPSCGFSSQGTSPGSSTDPGNPGSIRIWVGSGSPDAAKFKVGMSGIVYCPMIVLDSDSRLYNGALSLQNDGQIVLRARSSACEAQLITSPSLGGSVMRIKDIYESGSNWDKKAAVSINIGQSAYANVPRSWIDCDHAEGWGSGFVVESRYFGDANAMERTCIKAYRMPSTNHLDLLGPAGNRHQVGWDENTSMLYIY